ncbi:MAG: DUF1844 domain-containing protein [Thermodesulfobacteriota bacterium]
MDKEPKDKGFKITDKRHFAAKEPEDKEKKDEKVVAEGKEEEIKEESKKKEEGKKEKKQEQIPLPEMNFSTFIFSLNSSALFHFGEIPDPATNERNKNLPVAKQTIDIIGMLKEKTKGNLTNDEEMLIDHILYDLRMRYVEQMKKK